MNYSGLIKSITGATDGNVRTGVSGLIRQMMDAILQKYAVHEIIWRPTEAGMTAELRRVPLYFFENRTGKLKFVGVDNRADGVPLEDDGWMVTVGDGLGEALSILYMYKRLGVQDLIAFSEKFSVPGVLGRTTAKKGTEEGNAMRDSVLAYAADWVGITYSDDGSIKSPIEIMQTPSSGTLPQMSIIEYMDRAIATLVRGGDLSTISRSDGTGSNPQNEEADALLQDDCAMISETLQTQLDRLVIRMVHGDVKPAAYIVINHPTDDDLVRELQIDTGLVALGVTQDPADLAERYGREMAEQPPVVKAEGRNVEGQEVENEQDDARRETRAQGMEELMGLLQDGYADVSALIDQALQASGEERDRLLQEAAAMLPDKITNAELDDAVTKLLTEALMGEDLAQVENESSEEGYWITVKGNRVWVKGTPSMMEPAEAAKQLEKGFSVIAEDGGASVSFGKQLNDKLDKQGDGQERKRFLRWAKEAVRSGERADKTVNGEVRTYYGKIFRKDAKDKGMLVIVDTVDGYAFNYHPIPPKQLLRKLANQRDEHGEQPPLVVLQAYAAASNLKDSDRNVSF